MAIPLNAVPPDKVHPNKSKDRYKLKTLHYVKVIKMQSITEMKVLVTLGQSEVHRVLTPYRLLGHSISGEAVVQAVGPRVLALHDPMRRGQFVHAGVVVRAENVSRLGV